jgi:hypothetical protein
MCRIKSLVPAIGLVMATAGRMAASAASGLIIRAASPLMEHFRR